MIALSIILLWIVVGLFLYYVVEPYFRLRLNMCLADDKIDREVARLFGSVLWPIAIFIHPLIRYVLYPFYLFLNEFEKKVEAYWEKKVEEEKEINPPSVNEVKTGYRNFEFKK